MHTLIIVALGVFMNGQTGETVDAIARVSSVTACAQVINDNREPRVMEDGTWYLVQAECRVVEQ
jgi:hypothetical protein